MRAITIIQPKKLVFGTGAMDQFKDDIAAAEHQAIWIIAIPPLRERVLALQHHLKMKGKKVVVEWYDEGEPSFRHFDYFLEKVRDFKADALVGIGGGSVLDLVKILAAMKDNSQTLEEVVGIGQLKGRSTALYCLPTTSGTGSEVSPNAILLDPQTSDKKGVISPFLVPDATYVDPLLTLGLPPKLTAETGIDALSHCIEAYTNKYSHPLVDDYALRGIALIGQNLHTAYSEGSHVEARSAVSLGSMYGGLCLGPINTAAVHALSYPLGGKYHVPHGLANAVLLAEVMAYNLPSDPVKYAQLALAMGAKKGKTTEETAKNGIEKVRSLVDSCGISQDLRTLGVEKSDLEDLASMAMKVTRLMKNNPRPMDLEDAVTIYKKLF